MENGSLKKFLAGLCVATLLAGASLTAGCNGKSGSS